MEGRKQLPAEEVQEGRNIASLRIHVERAIGRLKNFGILNGTIPLSLSRLTNQIVHVCAFLCNFQPALVPSPQGTAESDVTDYIEGLTSSDSDDDSDCEDAFTIRVHLNVLPYVAKFSRPKNFANRFQKGGAEIFVTKIFVKAALIHCVIL